MIPSAISEGRTGGTNSRTAGISPGRHGDKSVTDAPGVCWRGVSVEWPLCQHPLQHGEDATYERGEVEAKWRDAVGKLLVWIP